MSLIYIVVEVIVVIMDRENFVLCARSTSVRESVHDQAKNYSGRVIFISIYVCWNMKKLKWGKHSWLF